MPSLLNLSGFFYLPFIQPRNYGQEVRDCIERTVSKLLTISTTSDEPGMLLGKIQSGKTRTFMGVIALAFDNGFDVCVVLTKGTKALAKQTCQRIEQDFEDFEEEIRVHDIMTMPSLSKFVLGRKLIFVVKKQSDNLARLQKALVQDYPALRHKRILVVDDEADFASIGYIKKKSAGFDLRTIAGQINDLRASLPECSFLQVTATPYSLYLQPKNIKIGSMEVRPIRPDFTELVPVHPDYVGGDVYFPEDESDLPRPADYLHFSVTEKEITVLKKKDKRVLNPVDAINSKAIPAFRFALVAFVVGAVIRRLQAKQCGIKPVYYSFLVHTEAGRGAHSWQEELTTCLVEQLLEAASAGSSVLVEMVDAAYDNLAASIQAAGYWLPERDIVQEGVIQALEEEHLTISKVNSDEEVVNMLDKSGQLRLNSPMNIFIGGQILDRGITIANMIGFFYGRNPKRFQQDTVLQHSRMYGFRPKEDVAVTRFYTAPAIYEAMRRMQESDNALRRALENKGDQAVIFIQKAEDGTIVPCNTSKILLSDVTTIRPHKRLLPIAFQTGFKSYIAKPIAEIDAIVKDHLPAKKEGLFELPLEVAIDLVERIYNTLVFEESGYPDNRDELMGALSHLSSNCVVKARRNRVLALFRDGRDVVRIRENSGRFMNAPDSSHREGKIAREAATELPVLMLLRQNGKEPHWRGTPFYWPVVLTPANAKTAIFANSVRPDAEEETAEDD
ncbi:MAG: Z1 domain-containing protein [Verrucomicrobiota bacterium]